MSNQLGLPPRRTSPALLLSFSSHSQVPYEYINTDTSGRPNIGARRIPTIVFPDGSFLQEPSNEELGAKVALFHKL